MSTAPRGKHRGIHWDSQPLGKITDYEIARRLDVDPSTVRRARKRRGISRASSGFRRCVPEIERDQST